LAFEQTIGGRLQHIAQIVLRYVFSDHFMERLTVSQRGLDRLLQRIIDEALSSQAQKAAMPDFVIHSPSQNSDGRFVWH
jgi:hypothetical protein